MLGEILRFFNGANARSSPFFFTILAIFGFSYAIDYNSACRVLRLELTSDKILRRVWLVVHGAALCSDP